MLQGKFFILKNKTIQTFLTFFTFHPKAGNISNIIASINTGDTAVVFSTDFWGGEE